MHLSDAAVQHGFWHVAQGPWRPPGPIRAPSEYGGGPAVTIACTQLGDPTAQRRLVREWVAALPNLIGVRFAWLTTRAPQDLFEAVCRVPHLQGLYIKWSGIKDLSALLEARALRYLHIGSSAQIADAQILWRLRDLVVLELENIPSLHELDGAAELQCLEQLAIEGSLWTTQHVASVAPLGSLTKLRHLGLANLRAEDEHSLRALATLSQLEHLRIALWWPADDVTFLADRLPFWRYGTMTSGSGAT